MFEGSNHFKIGKVWWENPVFSQVTVLVQIFFFDFGLRTNPSFFVQRILNLFEQLRFLGLVRFIVFSFKGFFYLGVYINPVSKALEVALTGAEAVNNLNCIDRSYTADPRRVVAAQK